MQPSPAPCLPKKPVERISEIPSVTCPRAKPSGMRLCALVDWIARCQSPRLIRRLRSSYSTRSSDRVRLFLTSSQPAHAFDRKTGSSRIFARRSRAQDSGWRISRFAACEISGQRQRPSSKPRESKWKTPSKLLQIEAPRFDASDNSLKRDWMTCDVPSPMERRSYRLCDDDQTSLPQRNAAAAGMKPPTPLRTSPLSSRRPTNPFSSFHWAPQRRSTRSSPSGIGPRAESFA